MAWTLTTRDAGGTVKKTLTQAAPGGLVGGFAWRNQPSGDCITLDLQGFGNQTGIEDRDLVQLDVNGTLVSFGVAQEVVNPRDPSQGAYNIVGARELLGKTVMDSKRYLNLDVALIVQDIASRLLPGCILYNAALVPLTGKVLSDWYAPGLSLDKAFENLGKSVSDAGVPTGVKASREFFFGGPDAPDISVAYGLTTDLKLLRINGADTVSKAYLLAVSGPSGATPGSVYRDSSTATSPPYAFAPIAYTATDPSYAKTLTSATFLAPAGSDLLEQGIRGLSVANIQSNEFVDVAKLVDGDLTTFAYAQPDSGPVFDGVARAIYTFDGTQDDAVIGFRLLYSLTMGNSPQAQGADTALNRVGLTYTHDFAVRDSAFLSWPVAATGGQMREIIAVYPPPLQYGPPFGLTLGSGVGYKVKLELDLFLSSLAADVSGAGAGSFKVYEFVPIRVNGVNASQLAASFLVPPASIPAEVRLPGLYTAGKGLTITGTPGGDLTGDLAEIAGEHSETALSTTIFKLAQPGTSETARLVRLIAQKQASGQSTDLRSYLGR
ncbi:hypothetical protein [Deinococcus sp. UYEF24]